MAGIFYFQNINFREIVINNVGYFTFLLYTDNMRILSIETSCDDTAVALVEASKNKILEIDSLVSSQTKIHAPFGGVVPNLAAREHSKNLPWMLKAFFRRNKISSRNVDLLAVTQGPGLIPALLIGTNAAKALAFAWRKPLVGVQHIAGHIYANFLGKVHDSGIKFPILALVVSGGHTELILMKKHLSFEIIGETLDDAAGEAFDKVARILGLGYPGGPVISASAEKFLISNFQFPIKSQISNSKTNNKSKLPIINPPAGQAGYQLPRPMMNSKNFNFSFSGLKTAVLYKVRDNPKILKHKKLKAELCAEFQQAVVDVLVHKTIQAAKKYKPKTVLLGGGVSANLELRRQLGETLKNIMPNIKYQLPDAGYSLDNAAMIAVAGYYWFKLSKNKRQFENNWKNLEADANLELM